MMLYWSNTKTLSCIWQHSAYPLQLWMANLLECFKKCIVTEQKEKLKFESRMMEGIQSYLVRMGSC